MIEVVAGAIAGRLSEPVGPDLDLGQLAAIAVIGWATWHGLASTVPSCTGASGARILGSLTAGAGPLRLPVPLTMPPRMMQVARQANATADRSALGS